MEYGVLYSGSTGNCTYLKVEDKVYLIDAGVSCKKIRIALEEREIALSDVEGIFLTHEHTDHVIGLKQLVDRHDIMLYTNEQTYSGIHQKYQPVNKERISFFSDEHVLLTEEKLSVSAYRISHDVKKGSFFVFTRFDKRFVYVTDTGYIPEKYFDVMANADGYVFESNHEPELVLQSRYPWHIQQRVLSDRGHLSNDEAGNLLSKLVGERTKFVTLAHLSQENNMPDIAYNKMRLALDKTASNVEVYVANPDNTSQKSIVIKE